MPVLALGVSYRRAPVELLERLSFADDDLGKAYRKLRDLDAVREAVLLCTCNRIEVFAEVVSYHAGFQALKRFLAESREVEPDDIAEPLYAHFEDDAAQHLFAVAGGLDSMVLGEPQILTQVRQAVRRAEAEGAAGSVLSSLFRHAVRAGKRVRAETALGAAPSGFVQAGMDLAERMVGPVAGRAALVVGAGGMARLAAEELQRRGAGTIVVTNRNEDRARRLADLVGGSACGLDGLGGALSTADFVISSTAAVTTVIGRDLMSSARAEAERPVFVLDLAVPRDVEPSVGGLPGVRLAAIDDLRHALGRHDAATLAELEHGRAIVDEEVRRLAAARRAARLAPLIQALRARGDHIQAAELARVAPRLSELSEREREAVESLARGIVAKLLHDPIVRTKELSGPGHGDGHARALAEVFGIEFRPEP